jgi:threonine dehydrogenase-like Zn-dependent dehydrogenase
MMQRATGLMPRPVAAGMMERVGIDRMAALMDAFDAVRRGGTVSITGVYGGMTDPMPMLRLFDKGVNIRMGQAHVKRWIDDIMPLLTDDSDPLDVEGLATHKVPLDQAPRAYEIFQKKQDGAIKIVLKP